MKAGFFGGEKPARRKKKEDEQTANKEWDERMLDVMANVMNETLDDNAAIARHDLERRVRTGTGCDDAAPHACGMPAEEGASDDGDVATRLIREHTKLSSLRDMVPTVMEQVQSMFARIKAKGEADKMKMDGETEAQVRKDILKEVLIRQILKNINAANSKAHAAGSVEGGLLATPAGYTDGALDSLTGDCIRSLMERGYGVLDGFMGGTVVEDVFRETELLDFEGKFAEVQQQRMVGTRTDKVYFLTPEELDREKQPGLSALFKKLISIPFELNKKCNLCLQATGSFQLARYADQGFYQKHTDGGYDNLNNGRKITAIYYANPRWTSSDAGQLRMYKRRRNPYQIVASKAEAASVDGEVEASNAEDTKDEEEEDVEPVGDRLVLLRARDMPHEVLRVGRKRFAISMYIMGPPGPGDQPDGHYTPS